MQVTAQTICNNPYMDSIAAVANYGLGSYSLRHLWVLNALSFRSNRIISKETSPRPKMAGFIQGSLLGSGPFGCKRGGWRKKNSTLTELGTGLRK